MVDNTARIEAGVHMGRGTQVLAFAQIFDGAHLGNECLVGGHAIIEAAHIGEKTKIWHNTLIRRGSSIGSNCIIGSGTSVDTGVVIGDNVKIQNDVLLYDGVTIEDGVFVGPAVTFTNDRAPRSVTPDMKPKSATDWVISNTLVKQGASLGARSVILPGLTIGKWALVGAGSIVTKDVEAYAVVVGSPARRIGWVNEACERVNEPPSTS